MNEKEYHILIKHCFLMGKDATQSHDWFIKYYGESAPEKSTIIECLDEFEKSDDFVTIERKEFRVLIKHCYMLGKNTSRAKEWLDRCYEAASPAKSCVIKWYAEFKCGRMSTAGAERLGRPSNAATLQEIEEVKQIVSNNNTVKLREIANKLKIKKDRAGYILRYHLACRYEKGAWGECNAQSMMTRTDKIKPNSDASCEQNRQITKKCKPKGAKPTKGNKGNKAARRNRQ